MRAFSTTGTLYERLVRWSPAVVLIVGLLITTVGVVLSMHAAHLDDQRRFTDVADRMSSRITERICSYEHMLEGCRGLVTARPNINSTDWSVYVHAIDMKNFPGTLGFGFIEYADRESLPKLVRHYRLKDPGFTVTSRQLHDDYFVVAMVEPLAPNRQMVGCDIGSDARARDAAEWSMITGSPTLSESLPLVQAPKRQTGALYMLPVYNPTMPIDTPDQRREAIRGWVFAPMLFDDAMNGLIPSFGSQVDVDIFHGAVVDSSNQLYGNNGLANPRKDPVFKLPGFGRFSTQLSVDIRGQLLTYVIRSRPEFDAAANHPQAAAIGFTGTTTTCLLSLLIWSLSQARDRAFKMAQFITHDLRASEERYRLLIEGVTDLAFILLDKDGRIVSWNTGAQRVKGFNPDDVIGRDTSLFHTAESVDAGRPRELLRLAAENGRVDDEGWRIRKDGSRFWAAVSITALRDEEGKLRGFAKVTRDISLRRQTEQALAVAAQDLADSNQQLAAARDAALASAQAKSEFLANMSHEIRTPMTAILGYADLLLEEDADPKTARERRGHCIETIRRNGAHLLAVINDILDLSKIEAGKMTLELVPASPLEAAAEAISLLKNRAAGKGLLLAFNPAYPLPRVVQTDPVRLRQILLNLLGNAIKFTERGKVTLSVAFEGGPQPSLRFSVADTGIGMSPENLGALFKPFSQADNTMSRKFGGTGLGLHISGRLAAMLGGAITVESTLGVGSTFTVTINPGPVAGASMIHGPPTGARADASEPTQTAAPVAQKLAARILLAEDGLDNQRLISHHLRKAGATVEIVPNGARAVSAVQDAIACGKPFDLVLMDMQMPEIDGYAATTILRNAGVITPIIALTAHAMDGDRHKCLASGCTDYATKPIDKSKLIATCLKHLESSAAA